MDASKVPDGDDIGAIRGAWQWIVFFVGLVFSGGVAEYWISSRYVTKKELKDYQSSCTRNLQNQFEIALLKNNERLEEKMIAAVSQSIRDGFRELKDDQP